MYVKVRIGETPVEKSYEDSDGLTHTFMDTEPVWGEKWETVWQPDHMPVGSVVNICVGDPQYAHNKPWTATVTGHARNGPRSVLIITDQPCAAMKKETGQTVNISHVQNIISVGKGRVVWCGNEYLVNETKRPRLTGADLKYSGKKKNEYFSSSVLQLMQTLMYHHPAFSYLTEDDHLYAMWDAEKQLSKLGRWFMGEGSHGFVVNKKKFNKAMHRLLVKTRHSRKKAQSEEAAFFAKMYEEDMEAMLDDL